MKNTNGKTRGRAAARGGVAFILLASLIYGCVPSLQESVLLAGASPLGLLVICNSVAGLASLAVGLLRHESFRVGGRTLLFLVLTGLLGLFLTDYLLNLSYALIPVGFTTLIHFLYPSAVCAASFFLFREKLSRNTVIAIALSLLGLVLISGGDFSGSRWGILTALGSGLAYAFYMLSNERSAVKEVPLAVRTFYFNLFTVSAALLINLGTHSVTLPAGGPAFVTGILCGLLFCVAMILTNAGIGRIGASAAALLGLLEPLTSLVVSTAVYRYRITVLIVLGAALILGSLLLIALDGRKASAASGTEERPEDKDPI